LPHELGRVQTGSSHFRPEHPSAGPPAGGNDLPFTQPQRELALRSPARRRASTITLALSMTI
jgi:hypothetical protein